MKSKPESQLHDLVALALERDPDDREDYLAELCGEDLALRSELEKLIAESAKADAFFDRLANDIGSSMALEVETAARPQIRIGPYRTLEAIGRGGMGVVYRAARVDGEFEHEVALKLLHLDMLTPDIQARFLRERQLLAGFDHPNIARLLDGGVTDEGRPYFVMELVDGLPITDYCREQELTLEETLRVFLDVVEAVSYLHRNLVVHRDLKPSNVFVKPDGSVKLLDFGIAKILGEEGPGVPTVTGEQLLTPRYAAPEQIASEPVTTATDVFGLGTLLFELLCGKPARETIAIDQGSAPPLTKTSPREELARTEQPDEQPSVRRWRQISKDLDNVCRMALQPQPERRYATADLLARDLERHLVGLPVLATEDTLGYRVNKFIARHRVGVAIATLVLLVLAAGFARERSLRSEAESWAERASTVSGLLGSLISSADPANAQGREVTVSEVLERAEDALSNNPTLAEQPEVEGEVRMVLGKTYDALGKVSLAEDQFQLALERFGGLESETPNALAAATALGSLPGLPLERRLQLLRQVIEIRTRRLGSTHPETLAAMSGLSRALRRSGTLTEAEALDRKILEHRRRVSGPDHPDTLLAMNSLAGVLFGMARYEAAARLYAEALPLSRERLGSSHPDTLRLVSNLGSTYSVLGRYGEAEKLQLEVLSERLRVLGNEHHQTGMTMHNLGMLTLRLARYSEAEAWFRKAQHARQELGGSGYLFSRSFLGDALRELGNYQQASVIYQETLAAQRDILPDNHPDTRRTAVALAELRFRQGELTEAKRMASEVLEEQLQTEGDKGLDASETLQLLAHIAVSEGEFSEAVRLIDQAHEIRSQTFGESHPVVFRSELERARILAAAGEDSSARQALAGLSRKLGQTLGVNHPATVNAIELGQRLAAAAPSPER